MSGKSSEQQTLTIEHDKNSRHNFNKHPHKKSFIQIENILILERFNRNKSHLQRPL